MLIDTQNQQKISPNIDTCLGNTNLFRLQIFYYTIGDCLFDSLQVLLHFCFTSIKLRRGLINYFYYSLGKKGVDAVKALSCEFHPYILYDLHGIRDLKLI